MKISPWMLLLFLLLPAAAHTQQVDTLLKKLDSLSVEADTSKQGQINNTNPVAYEDIKLDFSDYFVLLASDLKQQFTLPFKATGKNWLHVAGFAAGAGLVALTNKPVNRFAQELTKNNGFIESGSRYITRFGGQYEVYTLAGFYAYGLIFKAQKAKTTTALASQAYITAGAVQVITKYLTNEQRPNYIDPLTGTNSPRFHGPFFRFKKDANGNRPPKEAYTSFPSGHTTGAFAAATVYALEYKGHPWIQAVSYASATLIGLSRLTENKHWPSDIFAGAVLGFFSGRQVVNNYHRFSKIRRDSRGKTKPTISWNLQYFNGHVMPGVICKL